LVDNDDKPLSSIIIEVFNILRKMVTENTLLLERKIKRQQKVYPHTNIVKIAGKMEQK
jgi:hypothetical protein